MVLGFVKVFDPIFWSLECPLYIGLTVFSYDHDINIRYLYFHRLYIKNNMYKTMFIWANGLGQDV